MSASVTGVIVVVVVVVVVVVGMASSRVDPRARV